MTDFTHSVISTLPKKCFPWIITNAYDTLYWATMMTLCNNCFMYVREERLNRNRFWWKYCNCLIIDSSIIRIRRSSSSKFKPRLKAHRITRFPERFFGYCETPLYRTPDTRGRVFQTMLTRRDGAVLTYRVFSVNYKYVPGRLCNSTHQVASFRSRNLPREYLQLVFGKTYRLFHD